VVVLEAKLLTVNVLRETPTVSDDRITPVPLKLVEDASNRYAYTVAEEGEGGRTSHVNDAEDS
jgi:hypothetical protein